MINQVGAGKSSLLGAILGEMRCVRGKARMGGSVAYVTQVFIVQPILCVQISGSWKLFQQNIDFILLWAMTHSTLKG